jgi:hypothetical protein
MDFQFNAQVALERLDSKVHLLILGYRPTLTASEFFTIVSFGGCNRQSPTNIAQLDSFKDIIPENARTLDHFDPMER